MSFLCFLSVVQEEAKMEKKTKKEEGKEGEDEAHKLPPHKSKMHKCVINW